MKRLFKELRRREVFRTTGLYVGICWILIEVSSVVLPAFGAPDWVFRGAILVAVAGFPVMLVLAWFFDASSEGISLQASPSETENENLSIRKSDFAIIGVLLLALVVSVTLNLRGGGSEPLEAEPLVVMLGDFKTTSSDPQLGHVFEDAFRIGLGVASNIGVIDANQAPANKEGISLLIEGSVESSGSGFLISAVATELPTRSTLFSLAKKADSRDAVLAAISELAEEVRDELGAETGTDPIGGAQGFAVASMDAALRYTLARQHEAAGDLEAAAQDYEIAVSADPSFGQAYANLALVEYARGKAAAGDANWAKAQALQHTMTEREWLFANARYFASAKRDTKRSSGTYAELVETYPADINAKEQYAMTAAKLANFATAAEQTRAALSLVPGSDRHRSTLAHYEMLEGNWEVASDQAKTVIAADPENTASYFTLAAIALAQSDLDEARDVYARIAVTDASAAALGLADIDLYSGKFDAALNALQAGIKADLDNGQPYMAALKHVALSHLFLEQDKTQQALAELNAAVQLSSDDSVRIPAAMSYLALGENAKAQAIIEALGAQNDSRSKAYALMLKGMVIAKDGQHTEAVLTFRESVAIEDLWLARLQMAQAYLQAGDYLQALDEINRLSSRRGEATSVFMDDAASYRLLTDLSYWKGRVQEALNDQGSAQTNFEDYLSLRPQGGTFAEDAADRLSVLQAGQASD